MNKKFIILLIILILLLIAGGMFWRQEIKRPEGKYIREGYSEDYLEIMQDGTFVGKATYPIIGTIEGSGKWMNEGDEITFTSGYGIETCKIGKNTIVCRESGAKWTKE